RVASSGSSGGGQPSPGPSAPAGPGPGGPGPGGSGSGGSGTAGSGDTVGVTVRLAHPRAAGGLDQAPVTVNIVSAQAGGVLAVPISALVALAGGGYAVPVITGSTAHLPGVRTGLFSSSLVQVAGP